MCRRMLFEPQRATCEEYVQVVVNEVWRLGIVERFLTKLAEGAYVEGCRKWFKIDREEAESLLG